MFRFLSISALVLAVSLAGQAKAQPPRPGGPRSGGDDEVKKLDAELKKLQAQTKEVEAKLAKAKEAEKKPAAPGFGPFGRRMDPAQIKEMIARLTEMLKESEKPEPKKEEERRGFGGRGGPGGPGGMFGGFGRGPGGPGGPPPFGGRPGAAPERRPQADPKTADVEKKLERLVKEIDEIRKELKKK